MLSSLTRSAVVLAGFVVLGGTETASAQYPYPYPYKYPSVYAPTLVGPYMGPGGYKAGQAKVLDAAGNFLNQTQQAQILNQKALQEQINTEKMKFEWEKYKAANTPTFGQQQAAIKMQKEYRILTCPTEGEIVNGDALNILLAYLQSLANQDMKGPAVALNANVMAKINVITPYSAGSAGVLKNGGQVDFPIVLKGETQKELSAQIKDAVTGCVNGTLDFKAYQQVREALDQLKQEHKTKFHKDQIDSNSYLIGKHFLDELEGSVKMLEQPGSAQMLNGTYTAKGASVAELVLNMHQQGLRFAPAVPGAEPAYLSLHSSFVTYANGVQTAAANGLPQGVLNVP